MDQAVASSREGKTPIVFLKEKGSSFEDTLIIFRAKDFINKLKEENNEP